MKFIFVIIKRIILSMFILYGFNLLAVNFNLMVPINYITTSIVFILGFPGLFLLVLFKFIFLQGGDKHEQ